MEKKQDHKIPRLTKKQLELANVLRYVDERTLNIIEQIRAVAIAAKVSPEEFQKAFRDQALQDDFYVKLHVAEDLYEAEERTKAKAEAQNLAPVLPPTNPALQDLTKGTT